MTSFLKFQSESTLDRENNSALAVQLSKEFRTTNLLATKAQGHKVDALNPDKKQPKQQFSENNNNDSAHRNAQGGPNIESHPALPVMDGLADNIVIPDSELSKDLDTTTAREEHKKKHKKKLKQAMKPKPKQRLTNAPKYRSSPRPSPKPPGH